jgi:DNA replication protein DnaC
VGLAVEALKNGYTAYFLIAHELIAMIRENIESGRIHRKIKSLSKPGLLIIDEVGYAAMDDEVAHYFFQIISNRYEKGSIILTSNKSYGSWGDFSEAMLWRQPFWTGFYIIPRQSILRVTASG